MDNAKIENVLLGEAVIRNAAPQSTANTTGFDEHFEQAQSTISRLETLQNYGNSGEDPALAAFLAGQPHLITPAKREWTALVRERRAAGCVMQRVHVVTEPITDYLRFELTWGYQPNVDAGEDIRIVPVPMGQQWPPELPERTDFWLFDFSVLYALRYHQNGAWLVTEEVTDPARHRASVRLARGRAATRAAVATLP